MGAIRNILAVVGLTVLLGGAVVGAKMAPILSEFDPGYMNMYMDFMGTLLKTKDPGSAMVWAVPVEEGVEIEDVKESLKSIASEKNFLFVGESPFYKQYKAVTGEDLRHISFLSFCDVQVGKMMADYNNAYTAFMPCRVSVVEDKEGKLWLYSMNLDMMIYGGKELPPKLKKEALRISATLQEMMKRAAEGDF